MITISGQLAEALKSTREQTEVPAGNVFRLVTNVDGKVEFSIGQPGENDEAVEYDGEALLYVSDGAQNAIGDDRMIDVKTTPEGLQLVVMGS